eukprot:CAMPEP_0185310504 /NCGR_PEP_ID=MMETSP1363-20130426/25445_1 /TAXON_ID=38817 /ORGANISM="Gephyrocapsa oceanica, Strain RCC1303" /LENGTH=157 /DNA_ID=CAMNT_0027908079 /DNA_START=234 /DNA_END=707 /DNA_ORIENTATION=+
MIHLLGARKRAPHHAARQSRRASTARRRWSAVGGVQAGSYVSRRGGGRETGEEGRRSSVDDLAGRVNALASRSEAGDGVCVVWPAEEEDVRLRLVDRVVTPASTLRDAEAAPLRLQQQTALGHRLRDVLGQDDVPVLIVRVGVLFRVLDIVRHGLTR